MNFKINFHHAPRVTKRMLKLKFNSQSCWNPLRVDFYFALQRLCVCGCNVKIHFELPFIFNHTAVFSHFLSSRLWGDMEQITWNFHCFCSPFTFALCAGKIQKCAWRRSAASVWEKKHRKNVTSSVIVLVCTLLSLFGVHGWQSHSVGMETLAILYVLNEMKEFFRSLKFFLSLVVAAFSMRATRGNFKVFLLLTWWSAFHWKIWLSERVQQTSSFLNLPR